MHPDEEVRNAPFWHSAPFWGCISIIGVLVPLAVYAPTKHGLALLVVAWVFAIPPAVIACKGFRDIWVRRLGALTILSVMGLFLLLANRERQFNQNFGPVAQNMGSPQPKTPPSVSNRTEPQSQTSIRPKEDSPSGLSDQATLIPLPGQKLHLQFMGAKAGAYGVGQTSQVELSILNTSHDSFLVQGWYSAPMVNRASSDYETRKRDERVIWGDFERTEPSDHHLDALQVPPNLPFSVTIESRHPMTQDEFDKLNKGWATYFLAVFKDMNGDVLLEGCFYLDASVPPDRSLHGCIEHNGPPLKQP